MTVLKPDSSIGFFKNLLIFSAGLMYDYFSLAVVAFALENRNAKGYRYQRIVSSLGASLSILFCVLAIIGLFNILLIEDLAGELVVRTSNDLLAWSFELDYGLFSRMLFLLPLMAFLEIFNKHERVYTALGNVT
ncbi:hypothetical protein ACR77J_15405 [Tissierella praeacuta]|uniref:hypothetical protein n=1 Tax=Tissierella praeacuta TaxID=43131 RepID=UPI003DA4197C